MKQIETKKCKSGISELDSILDGGFPEGSSILISGGPGTGKSTIGLQFLFEGARTYNENGVYISLTELSENLIRHIENFNFYNDSIIKDKKVSIIDMKSDEELKRSFFTGPGERTKMMTYSLVGIIKDAVEETHAKRLVIDSITAIYQKFENISKMRTFVFELLSQLSSLKCTSLFVSEVPTDSVMYSPSGVEEFLTDGIIHLKHIEKDNEIIRTLSVIKMRGVNHSTRRHFLKISENGVELTPVLRI